MDVLIRIELKNGDTVEKEIALPGMRRLQDIDYIEFCDQFYLGWIGIDPHGERVVSDIPFYEEQEEQ